MPTLINDTDQLLKRWSDWSAGVGHLVDDGQTPGMYYASGLLGLRGELRPAPFSNVVTTSIYYVGMRWTLTNTLAYSYAVVALNPAASSTVAISGSVSSGEVVANATLTYPHTVPSGSNRALEVTVHNGSAASPTGVTFNGDALTLVAEGLGNPRASIWRRTAPAEATGNVVVTFAGATDITSCAQAYTGVDQTTPEDDTDAEFSAASSGPAAIGLDAGAGGMVVDALTLDNISSNAIIDKAQTSLLDEPVGAGTQGFASYKAPTHSEFEWQYFFVATVNVDVEHDMLYAVGGLRLVEGGRAYKVNLSNTPFGQFFAGTHTLASALLIGQPVKYQGFWYFPMGNDIRARKLSVVGITAISSDVLDAPATPFVPGADHFTILGDQLVGIVRQGVAGIPGLGGVGAQDGGVRILKVDGAPETAADWGSAFPAGEITARSAGLITVAGSTYVLNVDGLYSFNNKGRSRVVFRDYQNWKSPFENLEMSPYRGGILIPHPSGLQLVFPDADTPVAVGLSSGARSTEALPSANVIELHTGLHHSTSVAGEYVWSVYQPDPSSRSGLLLCGYSKTGKPDETVWQGVAPLTLADNEMMANCQCVLSGRPLGGSYTTPTVWFGNTPDLNYVVLDPSASPFRSRSDAHKVVTSGEAWLSELIFAEPVDLSGLVVVASEDMEDGDEWKLSMVADGTGKEVTLGYVKAKGRHPLRLDRHSVTRLSLHVEFTGTSAADRVPPVLREVSLFGKPAVGIVGT